MARKAGVAALVVVLVLYFLSGVVLSIVTSRIDEHLPSNIPFRDYLLAGLTSITGFIYWFIVVRLGWKGLKKLISG